MFDGTANPTPRSRARPRRLDLRVDADDARVAVEQRPARVAGVDGRVGLDRARDREAVRRLDLAAEGRHDAGRERPLEAEGVADRDGEVADADAPRVGQRQRLQAAAHAPRQDAHEGEVGRAVAADDAARDRRGVLAELDAHPRRTADDVGVRDDAAAAVEDESAALTAARRG